MLAKEGGATATLMTVLRSPVMSAAAGGAGGHAPTVCSVLVAVRQFSANDEICKEFADDGGKDLRNGGGA